MQGRGTAADGSWLSAHGLARLMLRRKMEVVSMGYVIQVLARENDSSGATEIWRRVQLLPRKG